MENNQNNTERIIQYIDGELTGSELPDFEKLLAEDAVVRAELQNLSFAKSAIQSYGLKQQVAGVHRGMVDELHGSNQKATVRKMYPLVRTTLKIAAGLFVFFIAFGAYQYATVSSSKLYEESYQPYKVSVARGESNVSEVEKNYVSGDFKNTIAAFEKLEQPAPKDYLLSSQAYMALHQPQKAIEGFNNLLQTPTADNNFKDDAEYYLAESYLENNEPIKAQPLLEKIYADHEHLYHDQVSYRTLLKVKLLVLKASSK